MRILLNYLYQYYPFTTASYIEMAMRERKEFEVFRMGENRVSCADVYLNIEPCGTIIRWPGRKTCYWEIDNHIHRGQDHEMYEKVDYIFASSRYQYAKRKKIHPQVFFIPNAADFNHFNKALTEKLPVPRDIRNIVHPIVAFTGRIDFRMNTEIIGKLSKIHPEWSIVLIGLAEEDIKEQIKKNSRNNVFFLGYKNPEEIPSYLQQFDVCIIPYLVNNSTKTMYPVKLHEYLATGKPVVCTNLPEVEPFKEVVSIAKTKDDFVKLTEKALTAESEEQIKKRVGIARENKWENRIMHMEEIMNCDGRNII